ncbi:MAG: DUF1622 domain-containing protein [Cyanobacteria bacterium]|nr:DUF1622 domain-containing protein [Cyanobacteriota bacterium]
MSITEMAEPLLLNLAHTTRLLLEGLSVLTVLVGLLVTLGQLRPSLVRGPSLRPSNRARLTFASWLAMALEFQLGADIVSTTTSPSERNLLQLALVAVIRTFLNVFLAKEIESEQRLEAERTAPARLPPWWPQPGPDDR